MYLFNSIVIFYRLEILEIYYSISLNYYELILMYSIWKDSLDRQVTLASENVLNVNKFI